MSRRVKRLFLLVGMVPCGVLLAGCPLNPNQAVITVTLQDENGAPIASSADPVCSIPNLGATAQYDSSNEVFIFTAVPGGQWTVPASAIGYESAQATVEAASGQTTRIALTLRHVASNQDNPFDCDCGTQGGTVQAFCAIAVWYAGRRFRRHRERRE